MDSSSQQIPHPVCISIVLPLYFCCTSFVFEQRAHLPRKGSAHKGSHPGDVTDSNVLFAQKNFAQPHLSTKIISKFNFQSQSTFQKSIAVNQKSFVRKRALVTINHWSGHPQVKLNISQRNTPISQRRTLKASAGSMKSAPSPVLFDNFSTALLKLLESVSHWLESVQLCFPPASLSELSEAASKTGF